MLQMLNQSQKDQRHEIQSTPLARVPFDIFRQERCRQALNNNKRMAREGIKFGLGELKMVWTNIVKVFEN